MGTKRKRNVKDNSANSSIARKKAKNDIPPRAAKPSLEKTPFAEKPDVQDRKREGALYELLGSEDENERIEAADCIVSSLFGQGDSSEAVLLRHLDKRLLRGLASGRNASRLGFSLAITEILSQLFGQDDSSRTKYPGLTFDKVLSLLLDKTQAVGNIPGQEERDHHLGQLFGLECFVRSKTLFLDDTRWFSILDVLLKLAEKKSWLRPQCGWLVVQALEQMNQDQAKTTMLKLDEAGLAKNAEGVATWLVALDQWPRLKLKPWRDPLASKQLGDLAAVLKESFKDSSQSTQSKNKQAGWTAQLHFVWDLIIKRLAKEDTSAEADGLHLFWSRVVDDNLFSKNATDGQKFKGFMVFQKMLEAVAEQDEKLTCLFSKNLMTCLMNQAAKEDRYLHRSAIKALKGIESVVSLHPAALAPVLKNLLGAFGSYSFDQRTNTKTVDKLLQNINQENAQDVLAIIRRPTRRLETQDEEEARATLKVYSGYLSKVLSAFASDTSESSCLDAAHGSSFGPILEELSSLAYSNPTGIPDTILNDSIRDLCRSRLETCLAKLTRKAQHFETFCNAVDSINPTSQTMTDEIKKILDEALLRMKMLLKRKSSSAADKNLKQSLALLHAISIFQLYNEDPDAVEVLDDLSQFYNRLQSGKAHDGSGGSSELLVEILLSMVARPSSLVRQVSQHVFDGFTSNLSCSGLQLLIDPLGSGESTKGQRELFNTGDDEESDASASVASDDDMDSDVEIVSVNGDADSTPDTDQGEQDDDDDKPETQHLDELVGKILNSHRLDKDHEASESSSDDDMSDSEMMALDEKLAQVFKQRAKAQAGSSTKDKKDAKQSVVNFKHRILDLVDIYTRNEALNPLAFELLLPLLRLMHSTSAKPLATRACDIILSFQRGSRRARASANDKTPQPEIDSDALLTLLVQLHHEAGQDKSHAYAKAASAASLSIAAALLAADRQSIRKIATVYANTQSLWVLGEARLQNSFFTDWNNWCQNHASQACC
ncbi:hypothetical protein CDD82_4948 [Ophiocordyceps australis]|uniref:DNA polymerase V n=1 Tax=Ophiocordyceps australis TaxID=1399860 RepID=A0A2C5Z3H2_9HYPO|nr:hypothetical protein CDD82_4948 [Ophiocordyceps australis]